MAKIRCAFELNASYLHLDIFIVQMKEILLFLLSVLICPNMGLSQNRVSEWLAHYASGDNALTTAIVSGSMNQKVSVGHFRDSIFLNAFSTHQNASVGGQDIYCVNLDSAGHFQWAMSIGGKGDEEIHDVFRDQQDNFYLCGSFEDTVDFNTGSGTAVQVSKGRKDAFLLKISANGHFQWVKTFGSVGDDALKSGVFRNNEIHLVGYFEDTLQFASNAASRRVATGDRDMFILKMDNFGTINTIEIIGGANGAQVNPEKILFHNPSGRKLIAGNFNGNVDFDPGLGQANLNPSVPSGFLMAMNANATLNWADHFTNAFVKSMDVNASHVYLVGHFSGTADFDPTIRFVNRQARGKRDGFVVKLNVVSGHYNWVGQIESFADVVADDLILFKDSSFAICGSFTDSADFAPMLQRQKILFPRGGRDIFLSFWYWDNQFKEGMTYLFGGSGDDTTACIEADKNDALFLGGSFETTASFNAFTTGVNATSFGLRDAYTLKLGICESFNEIRLYACDSVLSPVGNKWIRIAGTYLDTLVNRFGCDSVIRSIVQLGGCKYYTIDTAVCTPDSVYTAPSGRSLLTSGTYMDTINPNNQFDEYYTIHLRFGSPSYTHAFDTVCDKYWFGNKWLTQSGVYRDTLENAIGCDSVVRLDLVLNASSQTMLNTDTVSIGDSILIGQVPAAPFRDSIFVDCFGLWSDSIVLQNVNSCDSLVQKQYYAPKPGNFRALSNKLFVLDSFPEYSIEWQWLDTSISGGTYRTVQSGGTQFSPTQNGNYRVWYRSAHYCEFVVHTWIVKSLGRTSLESQQWSVYPNPSSSMLYVQSNKQGNYSFELIGIRGDLLKKGSFSGLHESLDIRDLSQGLYFLRLSDTQEHALIRFQKINK